MSIIVALLIGGLIGWLGARLVGRREGFFASIFIGIVGAFIGGFLEHLLGGSSTSYLTFSGAGLLWTLIGAVLFSAVLNIGHGHRSRDYDRRY